MEIWKKIQDYEGLYEVSNYSQVNHKDCNKSNNTIDNLEWCNQRYNYDEGMKTFQYSKNENHFYSKLYSYDL